MALRRQRGEGARHWVRLSWVRRGGEAVQARALLRPGASGTEVTGSREPVVTAWGWGGMCQGEEERGLGLWGSWGTPWVPGKDLRAA